MINLASYIIPLLVIIVVLKVLSLPLRLIKTIIINSILGGIVLLVLSYFGIVVSLTWWLIALTGLFGIPGLIVGMIITALI